MTIGKFALALACATALAGVAEAQQGNTATGTMGPPAFNAAAYSYAGGFTTWPVTVTYP